jgi:putative chitinase
MLTKASLRAIFPRAPEADLEAFISFGIEALQSAGILEMANRLQYFLAQLGHESNGLTNREENLNYSAGRLMEIWPGRFPTLETAKQYAHSPEKLANFVYGKRMGNADPGDGYRYRGRGYIQLTGRDTYREVGEIAGLDLEGNPELAGKPENAVKIACAYWTWKKLNKSCDVGDFTGLTQRINGGTNGLNDRLDWLRKVKKVVTATTNGGTATTTTTTTTPATTTTRPTTTTTSTTPSTSTTKPATTTTTPSKPKPPVEQPETLANPAVLDAQKKLTRLGYYKGVFNGVYDQVLRAALWAFQKDEDLPLTGRLDQRTRAELNV